MIMKRFVIAAGLATLCVGMSAKSRGEDFESILSAPLKNVLFQMKALGQARPPVSAARAVEFASVEIVDMKFVPALVRIKRGGRAVWNNKDTAAHTATGVGRVFDTGTVMPGQSSELTFDKPGTYPYFCIYHQKMRGKIIVE